MELTKEIQEFLLNDALERFLRYVKIWTTSDQSKETTPTTRNQLDLGKVLIEELKELNLQNIVHEFFYDFLSLQAKGLLGAVPSLVD